MRLRAIPLLMLLAAIALPQAARAYEVVLDESFGPDSQKYFYEGELDGRRFSYVDGEYEINTSATTAYGQSVVVENLETYRVEAKGRLVSALGTDAGFGLSFNYRQGNAGNEFMLFLAYDRGAFTVLKYSSGRTHILVEPKMTALFDSGDQVLLTVDSAEGKLAFYINGAEVARLNETQLTSGGVGMFATAGAVVRFDDFVVVADAPDSLVRELSFDDGAPLFDGEWGGVSYGYENGEYFINTLGTEFVGLSPFEEEAFDFEISIDARLAEGDPVNGYGVYIRDHTNADGGFNQFRFLVSGGWFAVERSEGLRPLALSEWARHSAIRENGVNRLKVAASGESLVFFINGIEVWRGTDPQPHTGFFGLYAAGGTRVMFDNASISTR